MPYRPLERYDVEIFAALTVILAVIVLLLPLPAIVGPAQVVFIPTIIAAILIALTEGGARVKLFSRTAWRIGLKWTLIGLEVAAGEEIGWRGYALPKVLARGAMPLSAALWLGVPWAILHLPLVLPGKMVAGTPPLAYALVTLSLAVILTWVYLGAGRSLAAPVLLHGGQNLLAFLNSDMPVEVSTWAMAAVYGAAAILLMVLTRGQLGLRQE